MLRKTSVLFFAIVILGIFFSCSEIEPVLSSTERKIGDEGIPSFNAIILEIDGNTVLVEPLEGEDIFHTGDRVLFATGKLDKIGASVGDIVTIWYDGNIMESYPLQVVPVSWSIYKKSN